MCNQLPYSDLLFSYGTLRLPKVQTETFGRLLNGSEDALLGWKQDMVKITDPEVLALSEAVMHPILRYTGNAGDTVSGMTFEVTSTEVTDADAYEVDDYKRVLADLKSGRKAWIYVASDTEYPQD